MLMMIEYGALVEWHLKRLLIIQVKIGILPVCTTFWRHSSEMMVETLVTDGRENKPFPQV